jgi:lauroyl/myristoyl acyltransferase
MANLKENCFVSDNIDSPHNLIVTTIHFGCWAVVVRAAVLAASGTTVLSRMLTADFLDKVVRSGKGNRSRHSANTDINVLIDAAASLATLNPSSLFDLNA